MAAVHSSSRARQRSSSDPFLDPSKSQKRPPPPPPKPAAKPSMTSAAPKSAPAHRDITEAVRDTVTVRGTTDHSPRSRVGRSQTALSVVAPHHHQQSSLIIHKQNRTPSANGTPRHVLPLGRRSQSQDSVLAAAAAVEKAKANGKGRPKKGSQHADVIDRLDFTGVGPSTSLLQFPPSKPT
jgi:hypothetical protein